MFDVKTIHGGIGHYYTHRATDGMQSGAVHERELRVHHDYVAHARRLDERFYPQGQTPFLSRLQSFERVRGLVYGAYGESASADVHDLIALAAEEQAEQTWVACGARSAEEMRQLLISRMRRRVGMAAVQAMARHRLARVPYVGVMRAVVQHAQQARQQQQREQRQRAGFHWSGEAQDVYLALALHQAGGGGRA